jgi:RNA polymerase sigma-70 factor, ECF subfamily
MMHAEQLLLRASRLGAPGRFQLEAAIQSAHVARAFGGTTQWRIVVGFYEQLLQLAPTVGAELGYAAALTEATGDPQQGLAIIDDIDPERVVSHQSYWAVRAHLLARAHRASEAKAAFERAVGLTSEPTVRTYLLAQLKRLTR